jgi:hypothetical protein
MPECCRQLDFRAGARKNCVSMQLLLIKLHHYRKSEGLRMTRTMPLLSCIAVAAAAIIPCLADTPGQAGQMYNPGRGVGYEWGHAKQWSETGNAHNAAGYPRAQELMNHDNLLPGQSRTQALRLEAETGHLAPGEDAVVDKAIKQDRNRSRAVAPHARAKTHRAAAKWESHSYRWNR